MYTLKPLPNYYRQFFVCYARLSAGNFDLMFFYESTNLKFNVLSACMCALQFFEDKENLRNSEFFGLRSYIYYENTIIIYIK